MHPFLEKMRAAARLGFNKAQQGSAPPLTAATQQLLIKSAWDGDMPTVRELVTQWRALAHHASDEGMTALHAAAALMEPEQIEWLIAAGAGVNVRDREGNTPLHYAAQAYCAITVE